MIPEQEVQRRAVRAYRVLAEHRLEDRPQGAQEQAVWRHLRAVERRWQGDRSPEARIVICEAREVAVAALEEVVGPPEVRTFSVEQIRTG